MRLSIMEEIMRFCLQYKQTEESLWETKTDISCVFPVIFHFYICVHFYIRKIFAELTYEKFRFLSIHNWGI